MSSSSASSWERVPSDYDILSASPTESFGEIGSPDESEIGLLKSEENVSDSLDTENLISSLPVATVIPSKMVHSSYFEIPSHQPYVYEKPLVYQTTQVHQNPPSNEFQKIVSSFINEFEFSRCQKILLALTTWSAISDGVEILCLSFVIPHIRCQMNFSAVQLSILSSIVFIGLLVGGFFWGSLGDRWGRRSCLVISLAMNGIFGLFSSFARNYLQLIFCRFMAGIGVGGSIPLLFTYTSEIVPQHNKGYFMSILSLNWMLANVGTAGLAYLILPISMSISSWRIFMALCTLPALTSSILFLVAPESPVWLASKMHVSDAIHTLKLFYPKASFKQLEQYEVHSTTFVSDMRSFPLNSVRTFFSLSSFSSLFTARLIRRTVVLWMVNCCTAFGFYGLSLWLPTIYSRLESHPSETFCDSIATSDDANSCSSYTFTNKQQYLDSIFFAVIQLPGNLATIWGMDRVGPRGLLSVSLLFNGAVCLALYFSTGAWASFVLSCFFSAVSVFSWNSINVVNSCYFPSHIRSTATGFFSGANRIGGLFGSLLIGVFLESGCGNAMFSLFLVLILGGFFSLKLPRSP